MISAPVVFIEAKRYRSLPFTEAEIIQLARAKVIDWAGDDLVFCMVGAVAINRRVIYVLPKFETQENCNPDAGQRYVRILARYFRSGSSRNRLKENAEAGSVLVTSFHELNSFYRQYGIFKERHSAEVASDSRKMNWAKTLQRNETIFVSHSLGSHTVTSAAYPKPVAVAAFEYDGQISRLFALVLSVLATQLSPILRISHPLSLGLSLDPAMTELNRVIRQAKVYSRLLRAKAESESGPRKRALTVLFTLLKDDAAVLKALVSRKPFVFGTQDFEYVWEEACLAAVGAERNSKVLAQPRMQSLTGVDVSISSQRADGILVSNDPTRPSLIVDAKYYTPRDEKLRFSSADLMKQFGYALSARSTFERKNIANALMLPGVEHNGGQCHLLGKVRLEMDGEGLSDVDDVHVLQVNQKAVFDAYMDGAADPRLLADVFENVGWPVIVAAGASDDMAHAEYEQFDDNGDYLYPNSFLNDPELVAQVHRHPIGRFTNEEWNSTFVVGYDEDLLSTTRHRFKFMASFLDEEIATGKQVYLMATLKEEGLMGVVSWDYIRQHHKSIKVSEDGIHRVLFLEMTETEWLVYASAKARVPLTRLYPAVLQPVSQAGDTDQSLAA